MTHRAVIVARIKPGSEEKVAAIFAESDATRACRNWRAFATAACLC